MANKAHHIVGPFIAQAIGRSMKPEIIAAEVRAMLAGKAHPSVIQECENEVYRRMRIATRSVSRGATD
jgi:hypothetical protein